MGKTAVGHDGFFHQIMLFAKKTFNFGSMDTVWKYPTRDTMASLYRLISLWIRGLDGSVVESMPKTELQLLKSRYNFIDGPRNVLILSSNPEYATHSKFYGMFGWATTC